MFCLLLFPFFINLLIFFLLSLLFIINYFTYFAFNSKFPQYHIKTFLNLFKFKKKGRHIAKVILLVEFFSFYIDIQNIKVLKWYTMHTKGKKYINTTKKENRWTTYMYGSFQESSTRGDYCYLIIYCNSIIGWHWSLSVQLAKFKFIKI